MAENNKTSNKEISSKEIFSKNNTGNGGKKPPKVGNTSK